MEQPSQSQAQLWSPGNPGGRITILTDHDGAQAPFSHFGPPQARPGSSIWVLVLVPHLGMYEKVHLRVLKVSGEGGLGEVEGAPQHCGLTDGTQIKFRAHEIYNWIVVNP